VKEIVGLIGTPVTAFTSGGELDEPTIATMFDFLVNSEVNGVATPMHIGESINMSTDERRLLAQIAVEAVGGRVPVLINISYTGTAVAADLARHAESIGADGLVCLPPYHWAPPPAGLLAHFKTIAAATELPMVLYNSPKLGVTITPDILTELITTTPNIVGMKDASFNLRYFTESVRVSQEARPEFNLFSGIDYPLPTMAVGGRGTFSLFAQLVPRLAVRLYRLCANGDFAAAKIEQQRIDALWAVVRPGYASGVKAALTVLGRPCGPTKLPVVPYSAEQMTAIEAAMAKLDFLADEPHGWTARPVEDVLAVPAS
jgi:dihydrodipicolinate synthase/N-acetylneuraminate lyase